MLFVFAIFKYAPLPSHGFGMAENWNFLEEKKVYKIIRAQNLENYNIVHLGYNTVAAVQKYLHKRDGVRLNYDDYYHNKYLFVVSSKEDFLETPTYEANTFKPSRRLKKWKINDTYSLYLLERTPESK